MKALRGVLNPFVTSALYEDKCSASRPGYFTLREISPSSHWIGVLVGTVNGLDVSGKKKTSIFRKKIFVFIRYSFCRPVTIPTKLYLPPNLVKWDQRTKECQTVIRVQFKCDGTRWHTGGKWRGNWRMEWVASTLHTTSELGVSSIRALWNVMAHAQKPDLVFQRNGRVHLNWRGSPVDYWQSRSADQQADHG